MKLDGKVVAKVGGLLGASVVAWNLLGPAETGPGDADPPLSELATQFEEEFVRDCRPWTPSDPCRPKFRVKKPFEQSPLFEAIKSGAAAILQTSVPATSRYPFDLVDMYCLTSSGLMDSVVAILRAKSLEPRGEEWFGLAENIQPLGAKHPMCKDEMFIDQPAAALCGAVLVDDHTVLTTRSCSGFDTSLSAHEIRFVFDYKAPRPGEAEDLRIPKNSVCAIAPGTRAQELGELVLFDIKCEDGFKRPKIEVAEAIVIPEDVFAIGFPMRLPAKFSGKGKLSPGRGHYLHAPLDIYPGSSGSPVFNERGLLVGMIAADPTEEFCTDKEPDPDCERWDAIHPASPQWVDIIPTVSVRAALIQRARERGETP